MIGNDVVDLKLAGKESNWQRKGFLEKIFNPSEQDLVWRSSDQNQAVWTLWSMKEAAYKVHQRINSLPRQLNWKDYQCEFYEKKEQEVKGLVKIGNEAYFTFSERNTESIFTTATVTRDKVVKSYCDRASMKVIKEKLLSQISEYYKIPKSLLSFQKNAHGIPCIQYLKKEIYSDFSLTDHGNFAAFSLPLMNC